MGTAFGAGNGRASRLLLDAQEGVKKINKEIMEGESRRVIVWAVRIPNSSASSTVFRVDS